MDAKMRADLLIRGGRLIDGSGEASFDADLAVIDDRIVAIGDLANWQAGQIVDASGLVVAPGFIDPHVHHDEEVLTDPLLACMTSQGVTSVINGNCGFSIAPLKYQGALPAPLDLILEQTRPRFEHYRDYRAALEKDPPAVNSACLIGHGTLRINEVKDLSRPADGKERQAMREALDQALSEGGIGLSTGPFYPPARAATTDELIDMARVASAHGKLYATHMRDEGDAIIDALNETFQVGRDACCGVQVSHHKCAGLANHGRSVQTLALIEAAMQQQSVGLDTTPWVASATMLNSGRHKQATRVIVSESVPHPELAGQDLADIAQRWGVNLDQAVERLIPAAGIFFIMDENDVQRIMSFKHTIICSDGIHKGAHPHPRVWGTFPRVLGHYARDKKLFSLEEAVKRMTSMPADRFGLGLRGRLATNHYADITIFDPATIAERATFESPRQPARGIKAVFVNGRLVWDGEQSTGARPGRHLDKTTTPQAV
jgi:N-acyl-D-amino-acid deacylase